MMETYSHLSPRGRIYNIERDIEKEHKELIAKFRQVLSVPGLLWPIRVGNTKS